MRKTKAISEETNEVSVQPSIIEIDGLCQMLNVGKNTAYNLLTNNEINAFKVGSVWKIPVDSIDEYISRKCNESKLNKMYTVVNTDRDLFFERNQRIPLITL